MWLLASRCVRHRKAGFYLRLTELGPSDNHVLRSVCAMTPQLTPASGREHNGFPGRQIGTHSALAPGLGSGLGARPGESDPGRMLAGVLLLVVATIIMVLALVWWMA